MRLVERLALQKQLSGLVLFKEGLFLKAYNESAYILTVLLKQNLQIKSYPIKYLNNQYIVECGFQCSKLSSRLPMAVVTAFGARLDGNFNLVDYLIWYQHHCHSADFIRTMAKAGGRPLQTESQSAQFNKLETVNKPSVLLPLTEQQLTYLQHWQKGRYPCEVEQGFIESLKYQVLSVLEQSQWDRNNQKG